MIFSRRTSSKQAGNISTLSERLVTTLEPGNSTSEAYRTLRTNLLYALVDNPPKVIVLSSPGPGEGKSTTCANLGVVLTQADKRVLIIDCDLRKPAMHKIFECRNLHGIVSVLIGERSLQDTWYEPLPRLKVLTAGPIPPNPAEMVSSHRFAAIIDQVEQDFDYILIDTPPIGLVSDPVILATQGEGVLLVLDAQNTRKGAVKQSMKSLEAVGANVIGTVMNNVESAKGRYYYGGYINQ